jgi:predicted negative regulator of RcsB-dependent stress response
MTSWWATTKDHFFFWTELRSVIVFGSSSWQKTQKQAAATSMARSVQNAGFEASLKSFLFFYFNVVL